MPNDKLFSAVFAFVQLAILVLYAIFVRYDEDDKSLLVNGNDAKYNMFLGVNVMIFAGFGLLMCFTYRSGFTALGHNFAIAALAIEWWILVGNFFQQLFQKDRDGWNKITLNVSQMIQGEFASAALLISFGALYGRASLTQMVFITMVEIAVYSLNGSLYAQVLVADDFGGTVVLHAFGAYFGLAVALMLNRGEAAAKDMNKNTSNYVSDTFSLIGTILLWIYWPSFCGALAPNNSATQNRVLANTFLALIGSVVACFVMSALVHKGKVNLVELQNATLAGGVAIGSSCNLKVSPAGALGIGYIAGTISTLGYRYVQPFLQAKIGLLDTAGVHNLHGMPGVFGGIAAIIATATGAADGVVVFTARDGSTRSNGAQAAVQAGGLLMTLAFAVVSGVITGWIASKFETLSEFYHDNAEYNSSYMEADAAGYKAVPQQHNDDKSEGTLQSIH